MKNKIKIAFQGENGAYSHLACLEMFPNSEPLACPTFEAAFQLGSEDQEYKMGVELIALEEIDFSQYDLYWRKLECDRNETFYFNLAKAHSIVHNRPYDIIPTDWIKSALHLNFGNTHKKKMFWCSALITFIYIKLNFQF